MTNRKFRYRDEYSPGIIFVSKTYRLYKGGEDMKKKSIKTNGVTSAAMKVSIGVLTALIVSMIGIIICALLIDKEYIGVESAALITMMIWIVSSLCGTMMAGKTSDNNKIPIIAITVVIYLLFMIGLKCILFHEPFSGIGKGILMILIGSAPSLFLFGKPKGGKKMKFKYSPK